MKKEDQIPNVADNTDLKGDFAVLMTLKQIGDKDVFRDAIVEFKNRYGAAIKAGGGIEKFVEKNIGEPEPFEEDIHNAVVEELGGKWERAPDKDVRPVKWASEHHRTKARKNKASDKEFQAVMDNAWLKNVKKPRRAQRDSFSRT